MDVAVKYVVKTKPSAAPVTVDAVKANIVLEDDDRDTYISSLIDTAVEYVENFIGWCLAKRTMEAYLDCFPADGIIEISKGPIISITKIEYKSPGETTYATLSEDSYQLDNTEIIARIKLDTVPNINSDQLNAIRITYDAGFEQKEDYPKTALNAIVLIVTDWYLHPENQNLNFSMGTAVKTADILLANLRNQRF